MKALPLATQYARQVETGSRPACLYVRQACARFLEGLERQSDPDYPYVMDGAAAERVRRFVELMPHVKGKWARAHEVLRLESWQVFIIAAVFGWKRRSDGHRKFRRVYIEVPRKNGKSSLTAAIGHYMLTADGEHGAEVYSGATSEKQAWEVFGPARLMARGSADYREAFGVEVGARNIHIEATASKFEPIIGKPGDGASPSFSITDEYHEHNTSEQYDTMVTGMGSREQPIAWVITTAGFDTAGPCYALRTEAVNVLSGTVEADELFALIYTIDDGDDWSSPDVLQKANPNYGVSIFADFLLTEQKRAIVNPREQFTFKTKHLNVWGGAAQPFFNLESWTRLADQSLTPEMFHGERCIVGLDLASKIDITANVKVFQKDEDGQTHYYVFPRLYIPQARADQPENRSLAGWIEQGWVIATPGDITNYDHIQADIQADAEAGPLEVASDPYNATQLLTHLQSVIGTDRVFEVPQTVAHLSEPMKELQALILDGRIHHDGNPCFAWMIGNVTAQEDRNQNVFPRKERRENKIDGPVALIIALSRLMLGDPVPTYDIHFVGA